MKEKVLKILRVLEKAISVLLRRIGYSPYGSKSLEKIRLKGMPRKVHTKTRVKAFDIEIIDSASFISSYRSIFEEEIYDFNSKSKTPKIIDGGANIGLATLYWKHEFNNAHIIAFEPDPLSFSKLSKNIKKNNIQNVELIQKGLWKRSGSIRMKSDGADGSHFDHFPAENEISRHTVNVTTLHKYIDKDIDMLKLDIEGAELEVLRSISNDLDKVRNMFVEYHSYVGHSQDIDELLEIIISNGFRVHVKSEISSKKPFVERELYNGKDNTLNIFAYRS
jgi:FkbM family methyltransferase